MRRIVVVGSTLWSDRRQTMAALRRVMATYREPYTLVSDIGEGAGRFAAAAARELGWTIEPHRLDESKCAPECPPGHRRAGGPEGTFCPTARRRNLHSMIDTDPDLVIALTVGSNQRGGSRLGQAEARQRGIALWTYETTLGGRTRNGDSSG